MILLTIASGFMTAGCGRDRLERADRQAGRVGVRQRGRASYYSNHLAGHPTASGEPYRPAALTAAHRELPFGTRVRVTRINAEGHPVGEPVVVRINDRGPFAGHRILDVSMAAARRLDMVRPGVIDVELEVVAW